MYYPQCYIDKSLEWHRKSQPIIETSKLKNNLQYLHSMKYGEVISNQQGITYRFNKQSNLMSCWIEDKLQFASKDAREFNHLWKKRFNP